MFRSNAQDARDFIEQMGAEEFYEQRPEYEPVDPPLCFTYIYTVFIELYNGSKDKITYNDIYCYSVVKGVKLTQYQISLLEQMSVWADVAIEELKKSEDNQGRESNRTRS